ncbi:MAG: hypothetical protein Q8L26_06845 [Candidatus Omnitrophota bacterium]|nr:hypothetical protein [Candidatus Omnitrophota bacterium]
MQTREKEFQRLKTIKLLTKVEFKRFGVNKKQEIIRLLYEISKREGVAPKEIIKGLSFGGFHRLKDTLLKRRFPCASIGREKLIPYLSQLKLSNKNTFKPNDGKFYPENIFIEQTVKNSFLAKTAVNKFPCSCVREIVSLKNYLSETKRAEKISGYNQRRKNLFIIQEQFDFFKKCPCTKNAVNCGYHIFNLGFGCIFDCTYCYLQEYINIPGIILPANLDSFFNDFLAYKHKNMRLGTGEFSDSLMLDGITGYSSSLIDFFKRYPEVTFEFKTKSDNIGNILKARHSGNIVVAWSLNPQKIIDENEFFTASLNERLSAAQKCVQAGHKVSFHFDPLFYFDGWQPEYQKVICALFEKIKPRDISWISLGTFRFKPELKTIIEERFRQNTILDGELLIGYDGKLRYPYMFRRKMYEFLIREMAKQAKNLPIYLCMEEHSLWKDLKLILPF